MWNAATIAEILKHDAKHYGFESTAETYAHNFALLKKRRDDYIVRLNQIYGKGFDDAGVTHITGAARFVDEHTLEVTDESSGEKSRVTAGKILIATGGRPVFPPGPGIAEHAISSDGFFELESLPKKAVVVGAGYIAVELAGVLNALGSEVHLVLRKNQALREFDEMIRNGLDVEMVRQGIVIHRDTNGVASIALDDHSANENAKTKTKTVTMHSGDVITGADVVLMAVGRAPNVEYLDLQNANVATDDKKNYIVVDAYSNTTNPSQSVFALGDVCGVVELTPMAIAAGRRLADRLFGPVELQNIKASYENVPTVVFSHPTIGTIGLTEAQAIAQYGADDLQIYRSRFANLFYGIFDVEYDDKPKTSMKVICVKSKGEQVVGLHVIGMGSDEMLQGFGVAMKMGCTKADLDSCVAIHPTAAEELVTMGQWGTSPQVSGAVRNGSLSSLHAVDSAKSNM